MENENPNVTKQAPLAAKVTNFIKKKTERKERRSGAKAGDQDSIGIVMGAKTVEEEGARTESRISDGGAAKGATDDVQESVRRSLERVESIKNLLIHSDTAKEFDHSGMKAGKPSISDDEDTCVVDDKH